MVWPARSTRAYFKQRPTTSLTSSLKPFACSPTRLPAGLRCAVPSFRAAGSLVGEHANGFKLVVRDVVGRCLKYARVERAGHTMASVCATVQNRAVVHGGNGAVLLEACFRGHQDGMPSPVGIENFFTS